MSQEMKCKAKDVRDVHLLWLRLKDSNSQNRYKLVLEQHKNSIMATKRQYYNRIFLGLTNHSKTISDITKENTQQTKTASILKLVKEKFEILDNKQFLTLLTNTSMKYGNRQDRNNSIWNSDQFATKNSAHILHKTRYR